jgi:hypothetical protein
VDRLIVPSEIEQIKDILEYYFPTYTINFNDENVAPSISIRLDDVSNEVLHYDHIYELTIRSTSEENLSAIVKSLLQLDSLNPDGFDNDVFEGNLLFTPSQSRVMLKDASVYVDEVDQTLGKLGGTAGQPSVTFLTFADLPLTDGTVNSVIIHLIPKETVAFPTDIGITTIIESVHALADGFDELDLATALNGTTQNEIAWEDGEDIEKEYSGWNSLLNSSFTDLMLTSPTAESETQTITFDIADVILELGILGNTHFPHHIEMKYKNRDPESNEPKATILLRARWAL